MKLKFIWAAVALLFFHVSVLVEVRGIPNSIGGGFINPAGMRLEDFVARKEIWTRGAELKGTWEYWKDENVTDQSIELLHLNMEAIVFGVPASEVTVQRKDDSILQFQVVFEPYEKIDKFDKLKRIVKSNASLWSGDPDSADSMKEGSSLYTFREDAHNKRLIVTITPQ